VSDWSPVRSYILGTVLSDYPAAADQTQMSSVTLESNYDETPFQPFSVARTLQYSSVWLPLEKLFRVYYYSSGDSARHSRFNTDGSADYDGFSRNMLSRETPAFLLAENLLAGVENTWRVATFPPATLSQCAALQGLEMQCPQEEAADASHDGKRTKLCSVRARRRAVVAYIPGHRRHNGHCHEITVEMTACSLVSRPHAHYRARWRREKTVRGVKRSVGAVAPRFWSREWRLPLAN
jgi:hypothetical protein